MMKLTQGGKGLYMHCLPADITGVSCKEGEVAAERLRPLPGRHLPEASYKPYVIAAMILLGKRKDPAGVLRKLLDRALTRSVE